MSLIATIENPRARKNKWEIIGAYNNEPDDQIWRFEEGTVNAAMQAYLIAKEVQQTTQQPCVFISINGKEEYDLDFVPID